MVKIIELFAGIGSQTQALKNIGVKHEVVGIAEIDKYAISSYMQLHKETHNFGDVSKIKTLPGVDLWTYSFPCQDLSVAGKGAGIKKDTRSGLLLEVERLLEISEKPKYLLMENVKNLIGKKNKTDFNRWCSKLEELGYINYWQVLNAKDYGIPQNRERVFMVSILKNCENTDYVFPEKEELKLKLKDMLENIVNKSFYLKKEISENFIYSPNNGNEIGYLNINKWQDHMKRIYNINKYSPTLDTMQGGHRQPKILLSNQKISYCLNRKYRKLFSIDYHLNKKRKQNIKIKNNFKIRKLTPLECWRLMGWKDDEFNKIKGISNTQLYKQAGNGIVVPVLEKIFLNLFKKNQ